MNSRYKCTSSCIFRFWKKNSTHNFKIFTQKHFFSRNYPMEIACCSAKNGTKWIIFLKTSLKLSISTLKGWKQFRNNRKGLTSNALSLILNSIAILSEILRYFYDIKNSYGKSSFRETLLVSSQDWGGTSQIHFTNIQDNRNTVWTRS